MLRTMLILCGHGQPCLAVEAGLFCSNYPSGVSPAEKPNPLGRQSKARCTVFHGSRVIGVFDYFKKKNFIAEEMPLSKIDEIKRYQPCVS